MNQFLNEQSLSNQYTVMRYDYDQKGYRPLIHAVSHLHIGFNNNVRIPLNKVISPPSVFAVCVEACLFE